MTLTKAATKGKKKAGKISREKLRALDAHLHDIETGKFFPFEEKTKRAAESLRQAGLIK